MNLYQKLAKIRDMSNVVKKDKSGYNYKYASLPEVLTNITAGMKKYGVSLIPMITPETAFVGQNIMPKVTVMKNGDRYDDPVSEMIVHGDMIFRWVDDENPDDHIDVPWFFTGSQKDPSMAFGASLSFCTRYFLTTYFNIALIDTDVDAYRSRQSEAEHAEEIEIAAGIIENFDTKLKALLNEHPENRDAALSLVKEFAKTGNYKTIKDPQIASRLMERFNEEFAGGEK